MAGRCISHREWVTTPQHYAADKVSVQNLKTVANTGFDAWGRPKPQPVEITAVLSLPQTVTPAASSDSVDTSTVHYGELSKLLLARVRQHEANWLTLDEFGQVMLSTCLDAARNIASPSSIELRIFYPKATRLGHGLCLELYHNPALDIVCPVIHLNRLQLSALVGVNAHERQMKQAVVVSTWIDRLKPHISDQCYEMEQLVAKTTEESSFVTLEALAESMAACIIKYFVLARMSVSEESPDAPSVRIKIEKPAAITAADAASVEIYRRADPNDAFGKRMASELGNKRPQIPFPLQGQLHEFLQSFMKQD